jgi:hypothetical protein
MDRNNRRDDRGGRRDEPRGQKPRYGTFLPSNDADELSSNRLVERERSRSPHHERRDDRRRSLHLEAVAMLLHNDMTAPTTDPDPATHATARPRAHQSLAASAVAADLAIPTQTAPILERANWPLPSLRRPRAMFR